MDVDVSSEPTSRCPDALGLVRVSPSEAAVVGLYYDVATDVRNMLFDVCND